jgi:hypothetical protein
MNSKELNTIKNNINNQEYYCLNPNKKSRKQKKEAYIPPFLQEQTNQHEINVNFNSRQNTKPSNKCNNFLFI